MKTKQLNILIGALVVLAVAFFGLRWWESRPAVTAPFPVDLTSLSQDTVDKIVLQKGKAGLVLVKTSNGWAVGGQTADSTKVAALWTALKSADAGEVVSTSKTARESFGITKDQSLDARFFRGTRTVAQLVIGRSGSAPGSVYLSTGSRPEVWAVTGDLATALPTDPTAWVAKTPPPPPTPSAKPKKTTPGK